MTERGTDVSDMKRTYRTATASSFPEHLEHRLGIDAQLRYGENPNQPGAIYASHPLALHTNIRSVKEGKGGLSATNFMDVARGMNILKYFSEPSVAVMKHLVPSGFATQFHGDPLDVLYAKARDADARSAFGSVVVINTPIDKATAEAIMSTYVECVAAPEFEEGTPEIFGRKKNLRTLVFGGLDRMPKFVGDDVEGMYEIKSLPTGHDLVQAPYLTSIRGPEDLVLDPMVTYQGNTYTVERDPTPGELKDLLTAWYVNFGVRSNGIVIVKDGVTLAVGTGQQERVGAVEQAIVKAYQKALDRAGIPYDPILGVGAVTRSDDIPVNQLGISPLEGAALSSDAFFPFRDSIDTMAPHGISAIIQPGGSERDYEVITAANQHKMAMPFTLERCFGHF